MSIPKQVEEAAQMAEEIMSSFEKTDDTEETVEEQDTEPVEEVLEEQPEEEETEEPELETDTQEEEDFKQKYLSLKGKYDNEVPRLNQELREFKSMVAERLGQVQKQEPEPEPKEPEIPEKVQTFLSEYGDEYADGLQAYFDYLLEQKLSNKLQPVEQRVNDFEAGQIETAKQNFAGYLDEVVKGDWQKLWSGEDKGFIDFLQQPDPSGLYTYGDLVKIYNDNWEADRLAGVFNLYLGKTGEEVAEQPAKKTPVEDSRIAPSRRSADAKPPKQDARIWTKEMIDEFQVNDRRGVYSPEESKALWDDLLAAPSQNRVRD